MGDMPVEVLNLGEKKDMWNQCLQMEKSHLLRNVIDKII